jgi:hypothetical protein
MVRNEKNEWKFVVPKDGESKHQVHDGRDYHWCPKHGYWTMHKPEDCKGTDYRPSDRTKANQTKALANNVSIDAKHTHTNQPVVKVNDALRAYIESTDTYA